MATTRSMNSAYLLLSGAVIVAIAVVFLLVRPMLSEIDAAQAAIEKQQAELTEREQFLQTIDRKIAALSTQQEHEARLQVVLPAEPTIEDVLRILHEAAASSGLVINGATNVSDAAQSRLNSSQARGEITGVPADVQVLGFSLQVTTGYQQLRAFLKALERSPRLIDVSLVTLQQTGQTPDVLDGQLQVTFYMQKLSSLTSSSL